MPNTFKLLLLLSFNSYMYIEEREFKIVQFEQVVQQRSELEGLFMHVFGP